MKDSRRKTSIGLSVESLREQIFSKSSQLFYITRSVKIDLGSSLTIFLATTAETRQQFVLEGANGTATKTCYTTNTEIPNLENENATISNKFMLWKTSICQSCCCTRETLPGSIDHLRHVKIPTLENLLVTVLSGQDNLNLISPIRVEQGPSSTRSASLFKLDRTITGPHTVLDDSKTQPSMHHTVF